MVALFSQFIYIFLSVYLSLLLGSPFYQFLSVSRRHTLILSLSLSLKFLITSPPNCHSTSATLNYLSFATILFLVFSTFSYLLLLFITFIFFIFIFSLPTLFALPSSLIPCSLAHSHLLPPALERTTSPLLLEVLEGHLPGPRPLAI